ncbi:hypothetical protein HYT84_04145 [Candidatus Micrarchaeota archaeon]|nr:hypothetical protein [Candidatus Micrarchaeota archaeon]
MQLRKSSAPNFRNIVVTSIIAVLLCPLVECGTNIRLTRTDISGSSRNSAKKHEDIKGDFRCTFQDPDAMVFHYHESNKDIRIRLDLPDGVEISGAFAVECSPRYTILVTDKFLIRALGSSDVEEGREILGLFNDGSFFPQNAIIWVLRPLGTIESASIKGETVVLKNKDGGSYRIDTSRPSQGAVSLN